MNLQQQPEERTISKKIRSQKQPTQNNFKLKYLCFIEMVLLNGKELLTNNHRIRVINLQKYKTKNVNNSRIKLSYK